MNLLPSRRSSSFGEATVTAGTTPDGEAPAGTGVASVGGAAWAGVVQWGGAGGDGQDSARWLVRRGRVGRESVRNHCLLRGHDLSARGRRLAEAGSNRCIEISRLFLATHSEPSTGWWPRGPCGCDKLVAAGRRRTREKLRPAVGFSVVDGIGKLDRRKKSRSITGQEFARVHSKPVS
jgi:hypothetical protein